MITTALAATLAACSSGGPDAATDATQPSTPVASTGAVETTTTVSATTSEGDTVLSEPGLQPLVDQAITDLSNRLGVGTADISVSVAELVVWPNQALGCPQEDMAYPAMPVDGSRIILTVDGVDYAYHTGGSVYEPFLCENPEQ